MRFCGNCGTALQPAVAAEERKLVTILFVDLVESTRFAGVVDPEQWRDRVAQFFAAARQEIERYGGTVEKFIGDAVMAVFGLPAIWMPEILAELARDAAALGRTEDAMDFVRRARDEIRKSQTRMDFPENVAHAEGRVLLAQGKSADALPVGRSLLDLVAGSGINYWKVPALLLVADTTATLGDRNEAAGFYTTAAEEADRMGSPPARWRALAGLAEVRHALGDDPAAGTSARQAKEIIDRLAATVSDERLRATFLQSARVQRVLTLARV